MTLPPARVLNIAMDMMVEATDPKRQGELVQALTGPFRTVGSQVAPEDSGAPAWWHGEDEAFASAQLAMTLPRGPRRRR